MSLPAKAPHAAPASSPTATARLPSPRPPRVDAHAAANDDAEAAPGHKEPDPLWMIVIAMAVFFGFTALVIMLG
jgi:hypothetical protein